MYALSKTRLLSFLQCPKRLWLEQHKPELLPATDPATQARFDEGHAVGDIARQLYDPLNAGNFIGREDGMNGALRETETLVAEAKVSPLFEATFERDGLLIRADVLQRAGNGRGARLIEVKSSTSVKDLHVIDCAIQKWVLDSSPAKPDTVALAHINNSFVYGGDGNYDGLLTEHNLTSELAAPLEQVPNWLTAAKQTLQGGEPDIAIGSRCRKPYECPFISYCWPDTEFPLTGLPDNGRQLDALISDGYRDIRDVPEDRVRGVQGRRVWKAVSTGAVEKSIEAAAELAALSWPRYYLDFETIGPAIPMWPGTRPYQQIPFQWSLHVEATPGQLKHAEFLDLTGQSPARAAAEALLAATGAAGPVFMYTAFERQCLNTLAAFCPDLSDRLQALSARLVDLHPIVKRNYYHPAMHGSWSIKAVLPTMAPEMDYASLDGVQEGAGAQQAWLEAIRPETTAERRAELREQLLRYCGHDTLAMVRVAGFLE